MDINKLLEILASENKLKIIAHYYNCTCTEMDCVSSLQKIIGLSQTNMSKHLGTLREMGILDVSISHRQRFYFINLNFKKKWQKILSPIINDSSLEKFFCKYCNH